MVSWAVYCVSYFELVPLWALYFSFKIGINSFKATTTVHQRINANICRSSNANFFCLSIAPFFSFFFRLSRFLTFYRCTAPSTLMRLRRFNLPFMDTRTLVPRLLLAARCTEDLSMTSSCWARPRSSSTFLTKSLWTMVNRWENDFYLTLSCQRWIWLNQESF